MNLTLQLCLLMTFLICTVHSDVELHQKVAMTKSTTKLAKIECTFSSECKFYIQWYQKKDAEPFKRIQYVDINSAAHSNDHGFGYLKSEKTARNKLALIIPNVKPEHSATYYCACWCVSGYIYTYKVFGSGTRLIVTDTPVKEPQVSTFTVFKPENNEKAVLLCQARGMYPDLVRFTWQAEDHNKQNVQLGNDEHLEQREEDPEVRITSMLIIDKQKAENNKFTCTVQHDSSVKNKKLSIPTDEDIRKTKPKPSTNCSTHIAVKGVEDEEEEISNFGLFALSRSLYLFSVTYVILLVKNVFYFCTVSVLLCMRNPANMEMIRGKGH
ncbi:M1-specific T cell receptor beta chain-like [Hemibagrus wyckioides]|uniref:M1-specific T cell receptor beta chain-like n=1 Tax=Hemibagrus wyckioides TaxID=337641 RepID=UPI00266BD9DF|nr:M1-specific T cell receptor beta chain-like [Hemibagrus wyckioides]